MEVWRSEVIEGRRPKVLDGGNIVVALIIHAAFFLGLYVFAVFHGLFDKPEEIIPIDLTVVVNENLDGKENEPPPLQKPEPPKPKPAPPKPKPKPKEPEKPKGLEKIVTNIVTKVDKKQEEKKPEKKEEKKKPEEPKKTAKELREERIKKMRESAKTVNKKVTIEVKNAPSGDGRTTKKTLTDAQIRDLLNKGYKPGTSEQLATSEMQRCLSLIQMAIKDKWDKMAPKIGNNGTVLLSVQFNSSGGLVNVRLAKSCGDRLSDDAALSVARSVSSIPGLSQEFISQFRREPLTVRYYVSNR